LNPTSDPDEFGTCRRWRSRAADGSGSSCRRDRAGRGGPCRTSPTRRNIPDRSARQQAEVLPGLHAARGGDGIFRLERDANGFFTSHDYDGRFVSYYGDNHPRYNGNVVKAMASAKDGYPHVVELFAEEIAKLNPADQPGREAKWAKLVTTLDDHCWRALSASSD
jgi:hypothetical protein